MQICRLAAGAVRLIAVCLVLIALPSLTAGATDLARPAGPVILSVTGAISVTNAPGKAEFDQAMLAAIGVDRVKTSTSWTDGPQDFEGVTFRKLLDTLGAHGDKIVAIAIDDYAEDIPLGELTRYPVLLAWSMNGKALTIRDKGPLWIVYPRDEYPELQDKALDSHWVWQLKSIEIK